MRNRDLKYYVFEINVHIVGRVFLHETRTAKILVVSQLLLTKVASCGMPQIVAFSDFIKLYRLFSK